MTAAPDAAQLLRRALASRMERVRRRGELPLALPAALPRCGFATLDVPAPDTPEGARTTAGRTVSILIDVRGGTPRLARLAWDRLTGSATPTPLAEGPEFWTALGDALLLPPERASGTHAPAPAPQLRQAALL